LTTHEYRGFVFTITRQDIEPSYAVDFPDIPDIITRGSTLPEAFAHACEALDLYLEGLEEARFQV
jgi:predicted RNase H-like HicB family nuclease